MKWHLKRRLATLVFGEDERPEGGSNLAQHGGEALESHAGNGGRGSTAGESPGPTGDPGDADGGGTPVRASAGAWGTGAAAERVRFAAIAVASGTATVNARGGLVTRRESRDPEHHLLEPSPSLSETVASMAHRSASETPYAPSKLVYRDGVSDVGRSMARGQCDKVSSRL